MKIIKPQIGGHDGSSFRELLDAWSDRGFCEIVKGSVSRGAAYHCDPDSPQAKCWINEMEDILLYDFPLLDRLKHDYNMCLFSNTFKNGPRNKKWIFWPWRSKTYEALKNKLRSTYESRMINVGFIGTPTNHERHNLSFEWSKHCDLFHYETKKVDHLDYLKSLSLMKYGLCLRGVGPKCLRDIELIGMGTVPIFTEGVYTDYPEPLIENVHYVCGKNSEISLEKINSMTKKQWQYMSNNCIDWFERNCSIEGSFNTTTEIINE
tara:strand:+ start:1849 stop:2640 length:792 start_codon:yes stop_codon:yes gene_type:complete